MQNPPPYISHCKTIGFTLVELSVVLVIIGLLVGGVMVGRDLIDSANNRAQIAQVESYITAARTFQEKYGKLPGDLPNAKSDAFGFGRSYGTGDGIIYFQYLSHQMGEPMFFWRHLSEARLISENLVSAVYNQGVAAGKTIEDYFPRAKLGSGIHVHVWGGGSGTDFPTGKNYMTVNKISGINPWPNPGNQSPGLSSGWVKVSSAFEIDTKIDDGSPLRGKVTTMRSYSQKIQWAMDYNLGANFKPDDWDAMALAGYYYRCFNNGNSAGQPNHYSMDINGGNNTACVITVEW